MDVDDHHHLDSTYDVVKTYLLYHDHGVVWRMVENAGHTVKPKGVSHERHLTAAATPPFVQQRLDNWRQEQTDR
jgi:hypothetical protein